ncbi:hypothetical protein SAMN02745121_03774 [Nannocystis exedens]|uniref:Uncharacterized protein n=1 Tax=Nannocystis exedens TaxID=54 RepID=A0A1I1ZDT7_9BACT|nr:hypothetical protein [Nannocystis exedens]PCC75020.1 hypothetical protein NAEX_08123 [Nannocystis exedens]SFE29869.1 hypothetical protein SAMN02745121_03774 [Nannocystis exedens]
MAASPLLLALLGGLLIGAAALPWPVAAGRIAGARGICSALRRRAGARARRLEFVLTGAVLRILSPETWPKRLPQSAPAVAPAGLLLGRGVVAWYVAGRSLSPRIEAPSP